MGVASVASVNGSAHGAPLFWLRVRVFVSGSAGVWGRLAALLVLCALLSVVLGVAGPSADAQVLGHPLDSCLGTEACTGLAFVDVGAGSCNGDYACQNASGPIGAGS